MIYLRGKETETARQETCKKRIYDSMINYSRENEGAIWNRCLLLIFMQVILVQSHLVSKNGYTNIHATGLTDPTFLNQYTEFVYQRLSGAMSELIRSEIAKKASFCIADPEEDWNRSFNYSSNLDFLSKCILRTQGDLPQRLCTASELKFYFTNFIEPAYFLQPNRNCNLTTWVDGCEPGWACSLGPTQPADSKNSDEIPSRTSNCQACCEGFFCPRGLTCMIPCPLGSYCPLATFSPKTGLCHPYLYQLPPAKPNHTCGGANVWTDVGRSHSMFCPAGSYCPTSTQEIPCEDGHYCRMGSTAETRCYKLTSCDTSTKRQNITLYGAMLIVSVIVVLFIFRNCYEKIGNFKGRRYARSREVAVKINARARARWLAAKDEVIKREVEMQHSLSCTSIIIPIEQDTSIQEIEEHRVTSAGVRHECENQDKKKQLEQKHIRGCTQIFNYDAYSQLEEEKGRAQQQGNRQHTFSRVISMAMNEEIRKRPTMEIAFRDLTVSLKQNKKHLLKSVTGEIWPGRITALMGPSGAGKTTLLSALAGKTIGCSISGQVLINGKVESIRSYKKIVGFVPQDDIVHGNLTVEENIWFTANCRLSADLPIADKVLVVERVIESLGLQPVRNSLVGTLEKRAISGGQRKRVNVGLELVMEPSLLLLDEPTSGLDSSSSQLLLKALRQEALEGVNICMVVHQPSYSLFKMFDDLILLAKGGLTVYHGAVRDVENYFAGLGINVPERINPPDHFIDVLEGMVKPTTNSGITCEELPLRWMFHKGYRVPLNPGNQENCAVSVHRQPSIWGEFWHNVEYKLESWSGVLQNNFMRSKDLSRRRSPSILLQYRYYVGRMTKQRLREARIQAIEYLILLLAGACLGLISKGQDENFGAPGYTYTIIATSLLCKIAALRTFALDKLQCRRERASGISSLAHFVAKDTVDHFNTLVKPLLYLSTFYSFSNPRSYFLDNYIVLLCLVYCVTGIAYMLAIFLEPGPSQLCSVILPVVLTLLSTQPKDGKLIKILSRLCYPSWALEAFIVSNAKRYYGVWLIQRCGILLRTGYNLHHWAVSISLLLAAGAAFRVLAFFGMQTLRKT